MNENSRDEQKDGRLIEKRGGMRREEEGEPVRIVLRLFYSPMSVLQEESAVSLYMIRPYVIFGSYTHPIVNFDINQTVKFYVVLAI